MTKVDGGSFGQRVEQLKGQMERNQKEWQETAVKIEREMKSMLKDIPDRIFEVYYIVFAKEIVRLKKKHSGETLIKELHILQDKWKARGLNSLILDKIKKYYIPSYTPEVTPEYFKLDISVLDGSDVLS